MTDAPTTPSPERQPADASQLWRETSDASGRVFSAPQAQPDARAVEALRAADEALAMVTAFESDARYIMGNTNFTILQQRREQVKKALQALSAPAADDGWRPIESAPKDGRAYRVSLNGAIECDGRLLAQHKTDRGYMKVTLGGKSVAVHRIVASAFVPNPEGYAEVNHLDGNKANNASANLEWCSRSENMKHAYAAGLHPGVSASGPDNPRYGVKGSKHQQSMPVRALFSDGSHKDYESQRMAEADGFRGNKISQCINGQIKTHGGAVWRPLPAPPAAPHPAAPTDEVGK